MNIQAIRDGFKLWQQHGIVTAREAAEAQRCPLFVYDHPADAMTDEDFEAGKEYLGGENNQCPVNMPYETMIVHVRGITVVDGRGDITMLVQTGSPTLDRSHLETYDFALGKVVNEPTAEFGRVILKVHMGMTISGAKCHGRFAYNGRKHLGIIGEFWREYKPWSPASKNVDMVRDVCNMPRDILFRFIVDVHAANHAVVSACPAKQGKSVEWVQSRTHYLILTRKQAQLCQQTKRGPTAHEIKRSAHARRAHFRVLRAARFKNKLGQRVRVKSCWVGPVEWAGADGKVYKIHNP